MKTILEIHEMSKTFGGLRSLKEVSLSVKQGGIVSIIGPNGAGKTTIFNCLTGFYVPTHGRISFEGREVQGMASWRLTSLGIARTFQNVRLFGEVSALENVMTGRFCRTKTGAWGAMLRLPGERREERESAARALELLRFVGLEQEAEIWARNLAYGKQRRLEIARSLATDPKLILLDEPAAGMNPTEAVEIMTLIRRIRDSGVTVLLIEHQMKVVMGISDRIIVLDHGEKIAEGTPEEVRKDPKVVEAYLGKGEGERLMAEG